MDENHIDAETEAKIKQGLDEARAGKFAPDPMKEKRADGAALVESECRAEMRRQVWGGHKMVFDDEELSEGEQVTEAWIRDAEEQRRIEAAAAPLVYQKEFFGFLLTVTKNSVGILIELHTSVKASAVFGLCCRFLTGLGVPAAQIGGVEPIFSEWLPFPDAEL